MAKKDLVEKAVALGIQLSGSEKVSELNDLIAKKEQEETSAPKVASEEEAQSEEAPKEGFAKQVRDAIAKIDNEAVKVISSSPYSISPGSDAAARLFYLAEQKKVPTLIPLENSEKAGNSSLSIIGNGLRINVLKGIPTEVPEDIGRDIRDSYYQTQQALNNPRKVDESFLA